MHLRTRKGCLSTPDQGQKEKSHKHDVKTLFKDHKEKIKQESNKHDKKTMIRKRQNTTKTMINNPKGNNFRVEIKRKGIKDSNQDVKHRS